MELENYQKRDLSISFWQANVYAIIFVFPVIVILFFIYSFVWGNPQINIQYPYLLILLLGAVIHELIHGLVAMKYSSNGIGSIKFGMSWKFLTPHCHCKEPLKLKNYRLVVLSPLYILGIIPTIIGFSFNQIDIFNFGLLFILAAGGI